MGLASTPSKICICSLMLTGSNPDIISDMLVSILLCVRTPTITPDAKTVPAMIPADFMYFINSIFFTSLRLMILITDNPIIKTIHEEILVMISKMIIIVIIPTDKQRFFLLCCIKIGLFLAIHCLQLFSLKESISESF